MNLKNEERRTAKRISYLGEVVCEGAGLNSMATRINDLSLSGAFINSMTCFAPGTRLRLRFHLQDILIETYAEVRNTMPQMGMGVQFIDLQPEHQATIECLIAGKPLVRPPSPPVQRETNDSPMPGTSGPQMLMGNFAVVSMFDVIQIIENNRLSGELNVTSPAGHGQIQFNGGKIASATAGSRTGTEALKSFLDVTEGSFEFRTSVVQDPPAINASSNMSLMLDLLRAKDEESAGFVIQ